MAKTHKKSSLWIHFAMIIALFLIVVNLLCGLVAVEFRYPSLWGTSNVFMEYAFPFHLSWGFAHLPSMLALSLLLFKMAKMEEGQISKTRCVLMAGIVLCMMVELISGGGRFQRIPFVLFALVDLSVVYIFSLLLHQRRRPVVAIFLVLGMVLIMAAPTLRFEYQKYLYDQKRIQAIEREKERTRRMQEGALRTHTKVYLQNVHLPLV